MTKLKNLIESFRSRLNHAEERINELKDRTFDIIMLYKQKEWKIKVKNSSRIYGAQWKETISLLLEFKKRKVRRQKVYLKRYGLQISETWEEKWASRSMRAKIPKQLKPSRATPKHIQIKLSKSKANIKFECSERLDAFLNRNHSDEEKWDDLLKILN